ncbi:unnamed protein product [Linum trigynum]|uniref:Uncharacterized protein n=1 Tax=Linum trigynum TaxID=586398 RepID=A0AAV2DLW2_9ROSI
MLIGNETDLAVDHRAVVMEDAIDFAEEHGVLFSAASTLSGDTWTRPSIGFHFHLPSYNFIPSSSSSQ